VMSSRFFMTPASINRPATSLRLAPLCVAVCRWIDHTASVVRSLLGYFEIAALRGPSRTVR
jgi:hypothetical protein